MKKLKYKLLLLSLTSSLIYAQDFDKSFLDSLPDQVKSDLLDETQLKKDQEQIQYRRPSTFVQKSEKGSTNRFGAEIFSMMQSTLMPINEPNFNDSYVLDFGDVLELQIIGQKTKNSKLPVKRDGSIIIDDIGKVYVAGQSLKAAVELITKKIKKALLGVDVNISLINVRDIQVIVGGNAFNPGVYTLNGNSNIFHALTISGGPSDQGSFRSISLIRDQKEIETIDLYEIFIMKKANFNTRLRSGDLIFINPALNIVSIGGGVKRPGVYEVKASETYANLIYYANGISNLADTSDISLYRIDNGKMKSFKFNKLSDIYSLRTQENDNFIIRRYPFRSVTILGAVKNPGSYLMNEGDGLYDLIIKSGGYSSTAYPFGGILENETAKLVNEMANKELYKNFINSIASAPSDSENGATNLAFLLDELKSSEASGRIAAEFDIDILKNNPEQDTTLQDKDLITIPEFPNHVYVFGEVASPGTSKYLDGSNILYYVNKKGGLTADADKRKIFALLPNGETLQISNKNIFMKNKTDFTLYPGTVIFIPKKTGGVFAAQTAQAYAAILGNIGVSLASISVLKD